MEEITSILKAGFTVTLESKQLITNKELGDTEGSHVGEKSIWTLMAGPEESITMVWENNGYSVQVNTLEELLKELNSTL